MTTGLTPDWLFSDSIVVHHYQHDAKGRLATPVPATEAVTGRFQRAARKLPGATRSQVISGAEAGREEVSEAIVFLPGSVDVGPDDEIEYGGRFYRVATVTQPSVAGAAGPAYTEVLLV